MKDASDTSDPAASARPSGDRFGPYRLSTEIDAGVATTVYRATHSSLGRVAAIKLLRDVVARSSTYAKALAREAKILSELSHPHIVALYDFVQNDDAFGLVLEHVEGFRLDAVREASGGRLRGDETAAIGAALADALAHAHARGVVHRDVKPGNVLLGKHGELKLFDFGAAVYAGDVDARDSAGTGDVAFGTPAYLAPEQLLCAEADPKADVYSLGVLLYELASGEKPDGGRPSRGPITPLDRRVPEIDARLAGAIERSLSKLPADRPTSEELASSLAAAAGDVTTARAVRGVLSRARLVEGVSLSAPRVLVARARPLGRISGLSLVVGLVIAVGLVAGLVTLARRGPGKNAARQSAPAEMGELRVLAHPWAEVWIDGRWVETTPFARPLSLAVGTHRVALRHPDAPEESREIQIAAGKPVMLDVTMTLRELGGGGEAGTTAAIKLSDAGALVPAPAPRAAIRDNLDGGGG